MENWKKHFVALFNGEYKKYQIMIGFKHYLATKKKKAILVQIVEFCALAMYWKTFPYPYFQHDMFVKSCKMTCKEMKNYIPTKIWFNIVDVSADYRILCNDKALFSDLMEYYELPQPKLILKYDAGVYYDTKNRVMADAEVDVLINEQKCGRIFLKDNLGCCGKNVFAYTKNGSGEFFDHQDKLTAKHIKTKFRDSSFILQEGIVQHDILNKINPDAVNTIRILTKSNNGKVTLIAAGIRFGRNGSIIDNCHAGGIVVDIDIASGRLNKFAKAYFDSNEHDYHPDSKISFEGIQLERWEEVKSLLIKAALAFHEIKYIGWDVVITNTNVVILEMNRHPCTYLQQMAAGGLADRIIGA